MSSSVMRRGAGGSAGARARRGGGIAALRNIDVQRTALVLLILVEISTVHAFFPILAVFRPGMLLTLTIFIYPYVKPESVRWQNLTNTWPPKLLLVFACVALASIPFGISMGQSGRFFLDIYSRTLILGIMLIVSIRHVKDLSLIVWSYVISIAILNILAFTMMEPESTMDGLQRLQGTNRYDSNDMGVLLNIGLPLALLTFQTSATKVGKAISIFTMVSVPAVMAMFGSRGGLVGLVAVTIVLLMSASHVSVFKRVMVGPILALSLSLAAPPGYWEQMKTIIEPGDDYNVTADDGRVALAKRGLVYMSRYPISGLGLSNFGRAEGTMSLKRNTLTPGEALKWTAPHNTYLEVGAELGVIALAIWLSMLFGGIVKVWRARRRMPRSWAHGTPEQRYLYLASRYVPAAFMGFAAPSAFVSHAYLPHFYILIAIMSGFFFLLSRELKRSRTEAVMTMLTRQNALAGPAPAR